MQTTEDKPIACTLDSETLGPRLAEIRALTATSLLTHELAGRVLHLRYGREAALQLRRIVELEQVCCAFLDFELCESPADVYLTITAPTEAGEAAGWLFAQFLPEATRPASVAPCGCSCGAACC